MNEICHKCGDVESTTTNPVKFRLNNNPVGRKIC